MPEAETVNPNILESDAELMWQIWEEESEGEHAN